MATTTNQQVHAHGTVAANVLTVDRADGCTLTRPTAGALGAGVYLVTVPTGFGSAAQNLKFTIQHNLAGAVFLTHRVFVLNQLQYQIELADPAGNLTDPSELWVTVEIVPRVS